MPMNASLPGPIASRHRERRSRAQFHWRADDYSVQPLAGPTMVFTRPGANGGLVRDVNGRGRFPTRDAPRFHCFDLDGDGIFEAPRLLLEPQSINLLLRSQEFDNAAWTKTRCSISANVLTAPDGTATGDKLVEDATASATHVISQNVTISGVGKRCALSIFVRADTRQQLQVRMTEGANILHSGFDVGTQIITGPTVVGSASHVRSYMEPWLDVTGTLWYRCVVIGVPGTGGTTVQASFFLTVASANSYTGDGTSGLGIWGAQLEETDNGATSYLATTSATITRNLESFYGTWPLVPGPLTMYAKLIEIGQGLDNIASKPVLQIGDGTTRSRLIQSVNGITPIHDNGPTSVGNQLAVSGLAHLDAVEFLATISPTGVANSAYALNGGAAGLGSASAANSFAAAYGGSPIRLAIGSQEGTAQLGVFAVACAKIAAGVRTMDEMREML